MFTISNIYKNLSVSSYLVLQARCKSKTHWAKLRKKTGPKYKALNHFDDFYGSVFGKEWEDIREAMLRRSKYVAVINNYGDAEETIEYLSNRGAHCLNRLITVQKDFLKDSPHIPANVQVAKVESTSKLDNYVARIQTDDLSKLYPQNKIPERLDHGSLSLHKNAEEITEKAKEKSSNTTLKTLDQSIAEAVLDESRIIDPSIGMTSDSLYQYIPASKLKGMDDWVPESQHYSYYSKGMDFPLVKEPETELIYPEHLKVCAYEMDSDLFKFPEPRRCQTGVYNYYPMDCGSVLTVLALGLCAGDRVIDLCSAPGGKALVALQTLLPDIIVCNDVSISRCNRSQRTFRNYLFDFETSNRWRERVMFKLVDGRCYVDDIGFDKVLVDVPCTTDRHSVTEDENNIFRPDRIKERLRIPELQAQLLINGLRLSRVGGTVVYSTCSLSPVQNDGVVHSALKQAFENHSILATVKDLTSSMSVLSSAVKLASGDIAPKYGQLVLPSVGANYGPTYISKLVRVK